MSTSSTVIIRDRNCEPVSVDNWFLVASVLIISFFIDAGIFFWEFAHCTTVMSDNCIYTARNEESWRRGGNGVSGAFSPPESHASVFLMPLLHCSDSEIIQQLCWCWKPVGNWWRIGPITTVHKGIDINESHKFSALVIRALLHLVNSLLPVLLFSLISHVLLWVVIHALWWKTNNILDHTFAMPTLVPLLNPQISISAHEVVIMQQNMVGL